MFEAKKIQSVQSGGIVYDSIDKIILNSEYKVLSFFGNSDGVQLNVGYDPLIVQNKYMLIKSFRIIPYADGQTDVFYNDTTTEHFTVPDQGRLINVIDRYAVPRTLINLIVNGSPLQIFPGLAGGSYPLDLFVDNIYYFYKSKIVNLNLSVDGQIISDLELGTTDQPRIKVLMEVYLF